MKEQKLGLGDIMDKEPWVSTASGKRLHPFNPSPQEFVLEDAVKALSRKCRFSGNMNDKYPDSIYSVGQHSVYVSWLIDAPIVKLWGLLHDVPEYVFGDMVSPVKSRFPNYREAEEEFAVFIRGCLGVPYSDEVQNMVDEADFEMFLREAKEMMAPDTTHWAGADTEFTIWDVDPDFYPWSPLKTQQMFLNEYNFILESIPEAA